MGTRSGASAPGQGQGVLPRAPRIRVDGQDGGHANTGNHHMTIRIPARPLLLAACISLLSACGSDSTPATPATPATYSGTLTDSAVAGVAYSTSSGLSGVTDANGHFDFHAGDTVTFRIGALELGTLATSGTEETVTPIDLVNSLGLADATTNKNLVTNLLVLLQSVDADGDPANGITIPAAVSAALTGPVATELETLLASAPLDFAAEPVLADLNTASGSGVLPVSPEVALNHFRDQFLANLNGTYTFKELDGHVITFHFDGHGNYVMTQVGAPELDEASNVIGHAGVEAGAINWDPQTGEMTLNGSPTVDTNLEWGLSHPLPEEHVYISLDGTTLLLRIVDNDPNTVDGEQRIARTPEPADSLLGVWNINGTGLANTQIQFLDTGHAIIATTSTAAGCESTGVEFADYNVSGNVLTFSNATVDTNGCAGIYDELAAEGQRYFSTTFTINSNGSVSMGDNGTLYRYDSTALL